MNPAGASILPVLYWLAPALASAMLLWFWRGRRVSCPPTCCLCGYDVSGRPADSQRCSECGADLMTGGAIVTSMRTVSWLRTVTVLFLFLASLTWFGRVAHQFQWQRWYLDNVPDSWIAWHVEGKRGAWADRSLAQWLTRYRAARLPADQEARLYDYLLDWQADLPRRWDPAMGDLLYEALMKGKLSAAQGERMARGTLANPQFKVRPAIRVGDVVPFEQSYTVRGGGPNRSWSWERGCFIHFDEPPTAAPKGKYGWSSGGYGAGPSTWREFPKYSGSNRVTPGPHRLYVLVVQNISDGIRPESPLTRAVEYRQSFDVTVLPAGTPIGKPFTDAKAAEAVATAVDVGIYHWGGGRIFAECFLRSAPGDRAFDVYVEYDGKRHWIARRSAKAGQDSSGGGAEFVPVKDSPDIRQMKMILVGSGDALAGSVDQQEYWKGTIEFPAVPLLSSSEAYKARDRAKVPHRVVAE
jgi:hypothetical protein